MALFVITFFLLGGISWQGLVRWSHFGFVIIVTCIGIG
jgi:hypothetical protein